MDSRVSTPSIDNVIGTPSELSIVATAKCDLDCSFCGGQYHMSLEEAPLDLQRAKVFEVLEKFPSITRISWTGGEPMLALRKMKELFSEIKEKRPDIKHELYTNGRSFKKEHVPFLKQFVDIFVSFDGYAESERPLQAVVDAGNFDFFEVLLELENVHTQTVLTRDRIANMRWHEDILKLYEALHHYKPKSYRLIFDKKMPKILSPDHVMNFILGYNVIEARLDYLRRICGYGDGVTVAKFFKQECRGCSDILVLQSDATYNQLLVPNEIKPEGCSLLSETIGEEAYTYINSFLNARKHHE